MLSSILPYGNCFSYTSTYEYAIDVPITVLGYTRKNRSYRGGGGKNRKKFTPTGKISKQKILEMKQYLIQN